MAVRITCPSCKESYNIDESMRGKQISCRMCKQPMLIPAPQAAKAVPVTAVSVAARKVAPKVQGAEARRPPKRAAKQSSSLPWVLIGGGLAALVILVIGVVAVVALVIFKPDSSQQTAEDAPKTKTPARFGFGDNQKIKKNQAQGVLEDFKPKQQNRPVVAGNGQLDPTVLGKVKRATVHIRVTLPDGLVAEGSGFFAIEPGIVLTNAHVLGMLSPDSTPPRLVEITYQSGEPDSRRFTGKILGVDRNSDLAVLRVSDSMLPQPLDVKSTNELVETQAVYVVGFPFGEYLGKNITVSTSSVSSLRRGPSGQIEKVQVNGGMNPGNSGGPVVNANGDVVGVAVSGIEATQINFAVPGEFVHLVLNGRAAGISNGPTVRDGSQLKMRIHLEMLDPLSRIKKVACEWWVASAGQTSRPASKIRPAPEPGDSEHFEIAMPYKTGNAQADIVLPQNLKPGQVIWVQPMVVNGTGKPMWAAAAPFKPEPPVDREPAFLALKHYWGARPVNLSINALIKLVDPGLNDLDLTMSAIADMTETMVAQKQGLVDLRLRYQKYSLGVPTEKLTPKDSAEMNQIVQQVGNIQANLTIDDKNNLIKNAVDLSSKTPANARKDLTGLHSQIQQALEALAVLLPGRTVNPGEQWTAKRKLFVLNGASSDSATMDVTYTFQGVRQNNGRAEGVISIAGLAKGRTTDKFGVAWNTTGKVTGTAYLDLTAFQFSTANVKAELTMGDGHGLRRTLLQTSKMERILGKELLNKRDELTDKDPRDAAKCAFKTYNVQLQAGQPCVISLESPKGTGWFDTLVRIEDANGKMLAQRDDGGVDQNALLLFTPPQAGSYRIVATSPRPALGNFLLVVRQ